MTNEELVERVQAGERDTLPALWTQVERFVAMQARKRLILSGGLGGVEFGDLYDSGYIALVAAADTYDPAAGCSFIGWLSLALKTAFAEAGGYRSYKQAHDPLHRAESLDVPMGEDEDGVILGDAQADPKATHALEAVEHRLYLKQLHAALETALKMLPEAEQIVLRARYYQGRTRREMGPCSRQIEERALTNLRRPAVGRELRQFAQGLPGCSIRVEARTSVIGHMPSVERGDLALERLELQNEVLRGKGSGRDGPR